MNFFIAFIVCLNSSANFPCSWSCQVSPSAAKRACKETMRSCRSLLKRFSSSANRRTCSGSITACAIIVLSHYTGTSGQFSPNPRCYRKPALFWATPQTLTDNPNRAIALHVPPLLGYISSRNLSERTRPVFSPREDLLHFRWCPDSLQCHLRRKPFP